MSNDFALCPECGSKKIQFVQNKKWTCPDCGFDLYCNVAAAVGLIIAAPDNSVLFETRAKEPRKGFLALPGGFCNPDESAESAAKRECMEEIGFNIDGARIKYVASFPNTYPYKNFVYKTCDLFFEARLSQEEADGLLQKIKADQKEVSGVCLKKVASQADIDSLPLAFDSAKKALKTWIEQKIPASEREDDKLCHCRA
ncbi:MAG: NUDIX domain-containing protein [Treponema sp.]|nr:NUDIX domain-containing protein [Treponema sp.]